MLGALVAIELVTVHMIDGRPVQINPAAVQQLIPKTEPHNRFVAEGVNCLIRLAGSYVSVKETCVEVQQLLEGK